jgi:hypothetical protein
VPIALFVVLALAGLLLVPISGGELLSQFPLLRSTLQNAAHPLVFIVTAVALSAMQRYGRDTGRPPYLAYLVTVCVTLGLGLATEAAQVLQGRDATLEDFINDQLGAGIVLSLYARRDPAFARKPSNWRALVGYAGLTCAVLAGLPLLHTAAAYTHRHWALPVVWQSNSAFDQSFMNETIRDYPALSIDEVYPNWQTYRELKIELRNLSSTTVSVTVRAHDRSHDNSHEDRYNEVFALPATSQRTLHIPLDRIRDAPRGRKMDLRHMQGVVVFRDGSDQYRKVQVDEVRLIR